jgi:hypothetical protein
MQLKFIGLISLVVSVTACQSTPEDDMPLPVGFEQQAQLLPLRRPVVTFSDDAWHQQMGGFQLNNMDLSGKTMQKVSSGTEWQTTARGGLLFQLIFHDNVNVAGEIVNKYNSKAEQSFSFDIQAPGTATVHSECQILVFGHGEETTGNDVNSYNWQTSEQELSYLGCRLTQDGQVSQLVVEDKAGSAPVYRLHRGSHLLDLTPVSAAPQLAKFNSFFQGGETGYLLGSGASQQAALQLSHDHSRIWLKKDLPAEAQAWYIAALFSLQMYHWQNDRWHFDPPQH